MKRYVVTVSYTRAAIAVGGIVVGGVVVLLVRFPMLSPWMQERFMLMVAPSAERAYAYGSRHLDAKDANVYDIRIAEYFFDQANAMNSRLPYLQHERARIAFLQGNFDLALSRINQEIDTNPHHSPSSYYVRGLIEGYMGDYTNSAKNYAQFIVSDPHDWAAKNDEAWVLLKAKRYREALDITNSGLKDSPNNPWLLNSKATALFELGRYTEALPVAQKAMQTVAQLTPEQWSRAYPGNDPAIAGQGLESFTGAVVTNLATIEHMIASGTPTR